MYTRLIWWVYHVLAFTCIWPRFSRSSYLVWFLQTRSVLPGHIRQCHLASRVRASGTTTSLTEWKTSRPNNVENNLHLQEWRRGAISASDTKKGGQYMLSNAVHLRAKELLYFTQLNGMISSVKNPTAFARISRYVVVLYASRTINRDKLYTNAASHKLYLAGRTFLTTTSRFDSILRAEQALRWQRLVLIILRPKPSQRQNRRGNWCETSSEGHKGHGV